MPAALPFTNRISQASTSKVSFKTLEAKFGNGYSQRTPDGINNRREEFTLYYENFNTSEMSTLTGVLDSVGSWDYLIYQNKKFKISQDGYAITAKAGDLYDINLSLEQVFDV